jgi:hypothetical protein
MKEDVILGTLLGDAWITRSYSKSKKRLYDYSFKFQQSKKEYAYWKASIIGLPFSINTYDRFDKRTNKTYTTYDCNLTLNNDIKEYYYNLFYKPKKEITLEILNQLTDLSICIWFLDDGNMYYNSNNCHISLAINGFEIEQRDLILKWFKNRYSLNFKHSQKAIRITSKSECIKFMNIVEQYIPECMKYKKLSEAINNYKIKKQNEK